MRIGYTDEQIALRDELRSYFAELMTPEVRAEVAVGDTGGPNCQAACERMGADGWLGIGWPREYGGQGRGLIEQFIFSNESWAAQAPVPILTINSVARTLMEFGTDAQKKFFLPQILEGRCHFAIGYSEPNAGTDLASLTTKAVRDGDEWVINGQKMWTSLAGYSDYIWLAVRTDPDAPKHAGISIMCVPTSAPGFSYTKVHTIAPAGTTATYYDDVRVPADALIGEVNKGWGLIVNQLNHERVAIAPPGMIDAVFSDVVEWARSAPRPGGGVVADEPWVRTNLARVGAELEALRLLNWRMASAEQLAAQDSSAVKVYGTEMFTRAYRSLTEVLGRAGTLRRDSAHAILEARLERAYQGTLFLTFGGGTNEIQRDLVALFGLGLPRVPRT